MHPLYFQMDCRSNSKERGAKLKMYCVDLKKAGSAVHFSAYKHKSWRK